jgi:hypothetical protein
MTDKDRAFEEWWTTSAPLQPMTPTAFDAGWDAHAERVKPLIEAARKKIDASTLEEHTVADAEVCAAIAAFDAPPNIGDRACECNPTEGTAFCPLHGEPRYRKPSA